MTVGSLRVWIKDEDDNELGEPLKVESHDDKQENVPGQRGQATGMR